MDGWVITFIRYSGTISYSRTVRARAQTKKRKQTAALLFDLMILVQKHNIISPIFTMFKPWAHKLGPKMESNWTSQFINDISLVYSLPSKIFRPAKISSVDILKTRKGPTNLKILHGRGHGPIVY
jgi:hypothetical protein